MVAYCRIQRKSCLPVKFNRGAKEIKIGNKFSMNTCEKFVNFAMEDFNFPQEYLRWTLQLLSYTYRFRQQIFFKITIKKAERA